MKKALLIVIMSCPANLFAGLSISEIAPGTAGADWVELSFHSDKKESVVISSLYVTMYYGANEPLSANPVTLYSYNRAETPWDDRYAVVYLTDALTPDETDLTGDTNGNGRLDIYCANYAMSLWNAECCAALDSNDDPSDGMLDFAVWSDGEGDPSETIGKYTESASSHGHWSGTVYDRAACIKVPKGGLSRSQSIIRISETGTNSAANFTVTDFQTPGGGNAAGRSCERALFSIVRRKIPVVPDDPERKAECRLQLNSECDIRMKVFSDTGRLVYESQKREDVPPGPVSFEWPCRTARSGLYIGVIEGSSSESKRLLKERFFFIVARRR
jgi:hypothetical protein